MDIDTRSGIDSLVVLLYELLGGTTPFDVKELVSQDIDVMRRIIRKKELKRTGACPARLGIDQLTTTAKCRPKTAEESNRKTYPMTQQPSRVRARWRSPVVGIFTWSFIRPMANWNGKRPEHGWDDR